MSNGLARRSLLGGDNPAVSPDKIIANLKRGGSYLHQEWPSASPLCTAIDGFADPTGATGDFNFAHFGGFFPGQAAYHIKGAGQTLVLPQQNATSGRLVAGLDQVAAEGVEYIFGGIQSAVNPLGGTVGDPSRGNKFAKMRFLLDDVSEAAECSLGFRFAEAAQANLDDYNDLVCLNVQAGVVNVETIVGGAVTTTTPIPNQGTLADDDIIELEVRMKGGHPTYYYRNITQDFVKEIEVPAAEDLADAVAYVPSAFFLQGAAACSYEWLAVTIGDVADDDESLQF
ncbi:MAG: hypothetical protein GY906_24900 [bacterium]|nr:hypothetical protein [bacterium]